jgi:CubicO group peptidase (beta-lactamase class C family)
VSESSRSLPDQPSLRFLRLEARRRLAAGEFTALWEAYLAIAREHGFSSWTALKQVIVGDSQPDPDEAVLDHLSWVVSRLAGASQPDWTPPAEQELAEHFEQSFLDRPGAGQLIKSLSVMARTGRLRDEVTVITQRAQFIRAQAGDVRIEAQGAEEPPHRLQWIRQYRLGKTVTDTRVAAPPADAAGRVPQPVAAVAEEALGELGLPGLVLAGADDHGKPWVLARGWARLDPKEPLRTTRRFPVYTVSMLITAIAVLRLAADGRLDLDRPANDHLRTVRLADGDITVRDLLTQTDGLANLVFPKWFAETVPGLAELTGPVLASSGTRGIVAGGLSGYAALGALTADVTGSPYPQAAARLVLDPLGMTGSSFPERWPAADERAVGCHMLGTDGTFVPAPAKVATVPAAYGLWTTAADLVRFGLGWSTLLPAPLAEEAMRPLARPSASSQGGMGLGWQVNESRGVAGMTGTAHGAAASLIVKLDNGKVHVALTNRGIPIDGVNGRVLDALAGA